MKTNLKQLEQTFFRELYQGDLFWYSGFLFMKMEVGNNGVEVIGKRAGRLVSFARESAVQREENLGITFVS